MLINKREQCQYMVKQCHIVCPAKSKTVDDREVDTRQYFSALGCLESGGDFIDIDRVGMGIQQWSKRELQ